jgi:ATP-dependent 26S proteasome regulatory subunit
MNKNVKKIGFGSSKCCEGKASKSSFGSPALNLKIIGVPKILELYDSATDLISFNRLGQMLEAYNISKKSLVMHNPFNLYRLKKFIGSKVSSYGGIVWAGTLPNANTMGVNLELWPANCYAELERGAYFIDYQESYIASFESDQYIVFDKIIKEWTDSEIVSFVKRLSKKLRSMKIECRFQDKAAFDSIFLPDEILVNIREDIDNFLVSRSLYKDDLNLAWRRGYMLVGPPGNGKTLLIRTICDYYGLEYFDIRKAIQGDGTLDLSRSNDNTVDYYLYPEEEKPHVCILEDLDKFAAFQGGEAEDRDVGSISLHQLLKGLDGVDQSDDLILIATTNFPDVLHEALTGRPGRFDKIYRIEKPDQENICKFFKFYKVNIIDGSIEEVAKDLKDSDSSMAFVAEFVKSAKMKYKRNDLKLEEARVILQAIHKHQELCKTHFKEQKNLGFQK